MNTFLYQLLTFFRVHVELFPANGHLLVLVGMLAVFGDIECLHFRDDLAQFIFDLLQYEEKGMS